jgi:P-type E1-E2 ATPase
MMEDFLLDFPLWLSGVLAEAETRGEPLVLIGWGGRLRGIFVLREQIRADVPETLAACRARGLDVQVLTGDHPGRGRAIARDLGVPVVAGLTPDEKIQQLQEVRAQFGAVAMVGDGINDAGACAAADVGIALGCGADVTRESAAICLISNELHQLPWLLDLSRRTVSTIRTNLAWSFGYNGLGVIAAMAGWLHPSLAAVLMAGSSLFVITNSLKLARETGERFPVEEPRKPSSPAASAAVRSSAPEVSIPSRLTS